MCISALLIIGALWEALDKTPLVAEKIADFTGINSPYEPPEKPDIELNTEVDTAESCADKVFSYLKTKKFIH